LFGPLEAMCSEAKEREREESAAAAARVGSAGDGESPAVLGPA